MKKIIILFFASLMVLSLPSARAQDLEDTIEDELDRGTEDAVVEEDSMDEELGEEPEERPKAAKKAPPKKTEPAPAPAPAPAEEEDDDVADLEEEIENEEPEEETQTKATPTPAPVEVEDEVEEEVAEPEAPAPKSSAAPAAKQARTIFEDTLTFDENANPQFEARIYEIFSNRKQVADEQWSSMVGRNSSGVYKVQRGDTLWDISTTFFGDGNFWPKLWSENSVLTNPHEISVGKAIAFIAGTEESAPAVSVTDVKTARAGEVLDLGAEPSKPVYPEDREAQLTEDDIAAGTVLEEQPIVGGRPDIPEPLVQSKPSLKNLPPSFVQPVPPKIAREFDDTGLDVGRRKAFEATGSLFVPNYLSDGKPDSVGEVAEIITREKTAAYLQDVIVKMKRSASPGEKFSALMARGKARHPKTKSYGPIIDVGGLIEIREAVNESRKLYRATVVTSVGPIELGALVTELPLPRAEFSMRGARVDLEGVIIGGQYSSHRRLLGPGAVVYLDKGTANGLSEGQILAVRSDRELRRESTDVPEYSRSIAAIKLVRVLERVSTAVIVTANEEVRPGDITGGPMPRPAEPVGNLRAAAKPVLIRESDDGDDDYKEEMTGESDDEEIED